LLDHLKIADARAELPPFAGVLDHHFEHVRRLADAARADQREAHAAEHVHREFEAFALSSDEGHRL